MKNVKWKDIQVGDEFVDGSVVEYISEIQNKKCYKVKAKNNEPLVLSEDHLIFAAVIKDYENKRVLVNSDKCFSKSKKLREAVSENVHLWMCIGDLYEAINLGYKIISVLDDTTDIEYIKEFENGKEQECFCISTDTGSYTTNGMLHHNTQRLSFYGMSDMMLIDDCKTNSSGIMTCGCKNGICKKCAAKDGKKFDGTESGVDMFGAIVSTNISEPLVQISMKQFHSLLDKQKVIIKKRG